MSSTYWIVLFVAASLSFLLIAGISVFDDRGDR